MITFIYVLIKLEYQTHDNPLLPLITMHPLNHHLKRIRVFTNVMRLKRLNGPSSNPYLSLLPAGSLVLSDSVLVQEPVIQDGGNQPHPLGRLTALLGTDDSPLAKHVALLLPRDRFRHLEDHFHKSIQGQCFVSLEEDTRLADVLRFSPPTRGPDF